MKNEKINEIEGNWLVECIFLSMHRSLNINYIDIA